MSDHGRSAASVLDRASSDLLGPPRMRPVVLMRLALQASPMMVAAWAFSPAVATITTRSAEPTSSIRSLVRPAMSLSQPVIEKLSPRFGALAKADAVKKLALFQACSASRLMTRSLGASSAMILMTRVFELGASMRNRASAADDILALSLTISRLAVADHTVAGATPGLATSASLAPSLYGTSAGSTIATERIFWCAGSTPGGVTPFSASALA